METSFTAPQVVFEQTGITSGLSTKPLKSSQHRAKRKSCHRSGPIKGLLKLLCSAAVLVCIPTLGLSPAFAGILGVGEILERGDQGPKVGSLQRQLSNLGLYDGPISNVYGALTESAVANYQRSIDLTPDGVFGARTDNALFDLGLIGTPATSVVPAVSSTVTRVYSLGDRTLQLGDEGADVRDLQSLLSNRFAPLTVDGVFGPQTQTMVSNFQQQYSLVADGRVGPDTLNALRNTPITTAASSPGSVVQLPDGTLLPSIPVPGQPIPISVFPPAPSEVAIGRSPQATTATLRAAQINQGPYIVVIPSDSDDLDKLNWVKKTQPQACMTSSRRGSYIFAGGYPEYSNAETVRLMLRSSRPDLDTARTNARVDYRRGDFTVECLY